VVTALIITWSRPVVRTWLLVGFATMRILSAFDLIPKALAFERADPATVSEVTARRWTRRSLWRAPLEILTCVAMLAAFAAAVRLA
jgi:hypothetical protein